MKLTGQEIRALADVMVDAAVETNGSVRIRLLEKAAALEKLLMEGDGEPINQVQVNRISVAEKGRGI